MSGLDEQQPICHVCGKSSYFTFRVRWDGVLHNVWFLDEKSMKKFKYKKPVVFGKYLVPKSSWGEMIDAISDVRCHACSNEESFNAQTRKIVILLKHIFEKKGGQRIDDSYH